ncbi:hypothetical protein QR680_017483 [Steinernema hermaphroditum]|uniref:Homeobox domain-containing protein n=1 Tax=Steinernema hermaphroditum TaxID=289476 RepID=A0AA39HER4_9BILA|nr:hypothetical protein QR680_017483 [Steinernema hermaphroditum]
MIGSACPLSIGFADGIRGAHSFASGVHSQPSALSRLPRPRSRGSLRGRTLRSVNSLISGSASSNPKSAAAGPNRPSFPSHRRTIAPPEIVDSRELEVAMFPMRVVVESVRPQHCLSCAHDGNTLFDSYAIVSQHTVLSNLVDTVLNAFNMAQLVKNSRGLVQINNWKPLPFEAITENPDEPIGDLFKEIHSHLTLKILTKEADSQSNQCINDVKNRLLKTALEKQPQLMTTSNNQIKEIIQQMIEGDESIDHDQVEAIQQWLDTLGGDENRRSPGAAARLNVVHEVPKLERWFQSEPNPSRQKLLFYMNSLNSTSYRKNHGKISYQQICNWFSNQRASNRTSSPRPPSTSQGAQIPLTVAPPAAQDFKNKFASTGTERTSFSNMFTERMDGGSDSPTPNDDTSVHSASDTGIFDSDYLKQENSSSPEMSLDLTTSRASTSPKPPSLTNLADSLSLVAQACMSTPSTATTVSSNGNHHSSSNGTSATASSNSTSTAARSRLMFDPLSELPILEKWFEENPHPSWIQIDQYTETLNSCQYRQSYPPISTHNVKIWFKNRRAKCKRMMQSTPDTKFLMQQHQALSEMS